MAFCLANMTLFIACNNTSNNIYHITIGKNVLHTTNTMNRPITETTALTQNSDSLLFQSDTFSSYVDKTKRGVGIVSFSLNAHDRLDIFTMDDTKFGEIVLNED